MLRLNEERTSKLNSAILHHQTDYKCPAMSDCPYTGKTLLEKRELPPPPPYHEAVKLLPPPYDQAVNLRNSVDPCHLQERIVFINYGEADEILNSRTEYQQPGVTRLVPTG